MLGVRPSLFHPGALRVVNLVQFLCGSPVGRLRPLRILRALPVDESSQGACEFLPVGGVKISQGPPHGRKKAGVFFLVAEVRIAECGFPHDAEVVRIRHRGTQLFVTHKSPNLTQLTVVLKKKRNLVSSAHFEGKTKRQSHPVLEPDHVIIFLHMTGYAYRLFYICHSKLLSTTLPSFNQVATCRATSSSSSPPLIVIVASSL